MQLTWKASESASALHAAVVVARGYPLADASLADVLAPIVRELPSQFRNDRDAVLAMLTCQAAAGYEQNHELVEQTLRKLWGAGSRSDRLVSELAAWVASVEAAYFHHQRQPGEHPLIDESVVDEIVVRGRPLQDLWDARGPGMLRAMGQATEPWLIAERADVVLVLPAVGGHGMAHLNSNLVVFEAVLTNTDQSLPEVVRLGWLLAQLQFDLPAITDHLSSYEAQRLAGLAMLPPALLAAERVELAQFDEASLARAAEFWQVAHSADESYQLASVLWNWWQTYFSGDTRWPVAVAALAEMLK